MGRVSDLLVKVGAFTDLEKPVILASGLLGIYYINTEKLLQDSGEWKKYGANGTEMAKHAVRQSFDCTEFGEVIDILAEKTARVIDDNHGFDSYVVSGGQRRDWIFSGPVAHKLKLGHVSLYKQPTAGGLEVLDNEGVEHVYPSFGNVFAVHIADLLTKGSSQWSLSNDWEGWFPQLRGQGITCRNLEVVVDRMDGGAERLARHDIETDAEVRIDKEFLVKYSSNPERALNYKANPELWCEHYLREKGALEFVDFFNPKGGKMDKAVNFMSRYVGLLQESDKLAELSSAVMDKYGTKVEDLAE